MVKLYTLQASPPARAVQMTLELLGVPAEYVEMNLIDGEHKSPEFLKLNPLHLVPVLLDDDLVVADSHASLMYLADAYGKDDTLYPKDVRQRTLVNQKLFFNSSTLFSRLRAVTYFVIIENVKSMTERQRADIIEAYHFLEVYLNESKFLAGDKMTIADIAVIATVTSLVHLVPINEQKHPKLTAWKKYMEDQPFVQSKNKAGADVLGQILKAKMV